jgi:ribosomal protein S18 acetylase RimI-like enzyme
MTDEFAIRLMTPTDASKLKEIVDLSFSRFLGFFAIRSLHEKGQVLVSETQETVVGFAKLIEFKVGGVKFGCILWVAVHPRSRRKGIAAALLNAGTARLKAEGAKAIFASVQRRNTASLSVFYRQGFRKMGFAELWQLFSWRVFEFYGDIWHAPSEIVLMHD